MVTIFYDIFLKAYFTYLMTVTLLCIPYFSKIPFPIFAQLFLKLKLLPNNNDLSCSWAYFWKFPKLLICNTVQSVLNLTFTQNVAIGMKEGK